jgi:diguanylate cyclase (GGDEF)-like protein
VLQLSETQLQQVSWAISDFYEDISRELAGRVQNELLVFYRHAFAPAVDKLRDFLQGPRSEPGIPEEHLAALKLVLQHYRRKRATAIERAKEKTSSPEVKERLDAEVVPLNQILAAEWVTTITAAKMPRLSDFLNQRQLREIRLKRRHPSESLPELPKRQFDDKFGILQPASLFLPDLAYFRERCAEREGALVVGFVDIDDFKKRFNTPYGEPTVDREVLGPFMQKMEQFVYHHGYAYRYGGDEYMLLFVNTDLDIAARLIQRFRRNLRDLDFRGIRERITLSIGLCEINTQTFLTEREIQSKANVAKNFAKCQGKDRVAAFKGDLFREGDLYILGE